MMNGSPITSAAPKAIKIPVVDIFGPVIQGEGAMIGKQTSFIRTGGCDFRCSKCDTLYAVTPSEVKKNSTWMTSEEIADKVILDHNISKAPWVTLSGGNPAMWNFSTVIDYLHRDFYKVAIETQGSIWKDWIHDCDQITVSPKGPGMIEDTEDTMKQLHDFMVRLIEKPYPSRQIAIKIPVFAKDGDRERDLNFAKRVMEMQEMRNFQLYLSLGNYYTPENTIATAKQEWMNEKRMQDFRTLADAISEDPFFRDAIFLPQLHVLAYGNERAK